MSGPPVPLLMNCDDARARLSSMLEGLPRHQWSNVRAVRQIAQVSRKDYVAALPVDALTADALQSWEGFVRDVVENHAPAKRSKCEEASEEGPPVKRIELLTELFQSEWFSARMCPFLTTDDACRLRAASPLLTAFVAGYGWDDLSCDVPFQSMHLWRKCFPIACGASVVLPTLPHPSSTTAEALSSVPHDAMFERFKGLRRLTIAPARGYVISDSAFAHLAGVVELDFSGWGDIPLLTDEGLKHLAGIRKLDFGGTFSLRITSEGFRYLSGVQNLVVIATVFSIDDTVVWQMTDGCLSHLRGIRKLTLLERMGDHEAVTATTPAITDAGFAHLQGIQELQAATRHLNVTCAAFSHLRGISSLYLESECSDLVTDDTLACLSGIQSLALQSAPLITDAGLSHLGGVKTLHLPFCPQLTGAGFVHLAGIRDLDISGGLLVTDSGFQYLRGIHTLDMTDCPLVTDAAFAHLAGIDTLRMQDCNQETISNKAFKHLAGIRSLNMSGCDQSTITAAALRHVAGIQNLNMDFCSLEVDAKAFGKLHSLTSISLEDASLSTILAALRAFADDESLQTSLWRALSCCNEAMDSVEAYQCDALTPFFDLTTAESVITMLRAGLRNHCSCHPPAAAEIDLAEGGILAGAAAEVALGARFLVHLAASPSERSQLYADDVVRVLLAYICDPSWSQIHHLLCTALEELCEYPEFAAQVFNQGTTTKFSVAALSGVLNHIDEEPVNRLDTWQGVETCAAACRTLCSVLKHHPDAGTVLLGLDVLPLLMKMLGPNNNTGDSSHAVAACALVVAIVRALAVTGSNAEFVASVLKPASVRDMLQGLTGAEDPSDLSDICSSVNEVLAWGSEVASMPLPTTAVFTILKLWDLHPEDRDVSRAACAALLRRASPKGTGSTTHLDALSSAASISRLVSGVRMHGEDTGTLRLLVRLVQLVASQGAPTNKLLVESGVLAALRACRTAYMLPHADDSMLKHLNEVISRLVVLKGIS